MNNTTETNEVKDQPTIDNGVVEELFLQIASDEQVEIYFNYDGHKNEKALKTMYASRRLLETVPTLLRYYNDTNILAFGQSGEDAIYAILLGQSS